MELIINPVTRLESNLLSIMFNAPSSLNAKDYQDYIYKSLIDLEYRTNKEAPARYTRNNNFPVSGRIDILIELHNKKIGIELDRVKPRTYSIKKCKLFNLGYIITRESNSLYKIT